MPLPPILSASLPPPPGPIKNIGYAHLYSPAKSPYAHPEPILAETNKPALQVEEISYCLYYPADLTTTKQRGKSTITKGVRWVPEPFWGVVRGYERFMGDRAGMRWIASTLGIIAGRLKMPIYSLAPLLPPSSKPKYPLVLFSHGLAGTRHTYSQYCQSIASEGYVVLAIEHRDGSGPAVQFSLEHTRATATAPSTPAASPTGSADGSSSASSVPVVADTSIAESAKKEQEESDETKPIPKEGRILHYIKQGDVHWPDGEDKSLTHFRSWQLDIRTREVHEAYYSFKHLVQSATATATASGSGSASDDGTRETNESMRDILKDKVNVTVEGLKGNDKWDWVKRFVNVDFEDLRLTGHSFGGGTMLHLVQTPSPDPKKLPPLPVKQLLALDPWIEALPLPAPKAEGSPDMPPLAVINSVGFTEWTDHFKRLTKIVSEAKGSLMTVVGVGHQTFSDFPLLSPTSHGSAQFLLGRIHQLSSAFLGSRTGLEDLPELKGKQADTGDYEKEDDGKTMKARKFKDGEVVLHFLGGE